jgi:hypothetical protein
MSKHIEPIKANSRDGGEVYRLLCMVHSMAGRLANSSSKDFWLARTQGDPMLGPLVTVWSNGIVDIEARTWKEHEGDYHEYYMYATKKGDDNE